jgi:hypothetical protein
MLDTIRKEDLELSVDKTSPKFTSAARGGVVGWGTILQPGRSPVGVPDKVEFFSLPNPSSRTVALGSTQPLTEIFLGVKSGRRLGLNLAAVYEPIVRKCGSLNLSQP